MNVYALIVAGGSGERMGAGLPKQFLPLHGKPVLWHTLTAFQQAFAAIQILLVLPENHLGTGKSIAASVRDPDNVQIVAGGTSRFHSVQNGLRQLSHDAVVLIHDGVRCLVTPLLIKRCYAAALLHGNAIPAIEPVDSLRMITATGSQPVDRSLVRIIQTPQTFYGGVICKAYEQPYDAAFTDDASVLERWGSAIHLVEGEAENIKITRPVDLLVAEKILKEREKTKRI